MFFVKLKPGRVKTIRSRLEFILSLGSKLLEFITGRSFGNVIELKLSINIEVNVQTMISFRNGKKVQEEGPLFENRYKLLSGQGK